MRPIHLILPVTFTNWTQHAHFNVRTVSFPLLCPHRAHTLSVCLTAFNLIATIISAKQNKIWSLLAYNLLCMQLLHVYYYYYYYYHHHNHHYDNVINSTPLNY
jgi:hypothetical protein